MSGFGRFYASEVADDADTTTSIAHAELARMVGERELEACFQVICPYTGEALETYELGDKIPL